jgi:hypothetical protein
MTNNKLHFIKKTIGYYLIVLSVSILLYVFSKHNLLFDLTAKKFTLAFTENSLSVKHEIAEERRVVFQSILLNKNKHYNNLIIGSSRVMQFGKKTGFNNALNLGVSGASLFDIKFIYDLSQRNNITFDTIIFDFNPWLVIKEPDSRYKQFIFKYQIENAFYDIFKFSYNSVDLKTCLGVLNDYKKSYRIANSSDILISSYFIKNKDGSIQQKKLNHSDRKKSIASFVKGFYNMSNFRNIDYDLFEQSLQLYNIASNKGKCYITLTPFHMDLFRLHNKDVRVENILKTEELLRSSKHFFSILGSFNPHTIDVYEDDFYDGFHLKEKSIYKIFNSNNSIQNN